MPYRRLLHLSPHPKTGHQSTIPQLRLSLVPIAGAIAGVSAAAAYLDAKYHLRQDIATIRGDTATEREFAKISEF